MLTEQMKQKIEREVEAQKEYLKEKEIVNASYKRLVESERKLMEEEEKKKKAYYETMLEQYQLKEEIRINAIQENQKELEKIQQYQSKLDQRDRNQKIEN